MADGCAAGVMEAPFAGRWKSDVEKLPLQLQKGRDLCRVETVGGRDLHVSSYGEIQDTLTIKDFPLRILSLTHRQVTGNEKDIAHVKVLSLDLSPALLSVRQTEASKALRTFEEESNLQLKTSASRPSTKEKCAGFLRVLVAMSIMSDPALRTAASTVYCIYNCTYFYI